MRRLPHHLPGDTQLLRQLPPAARRRFEALLEQQHRDELDHRSHTVSGEHLELLAHRARFGDGAGGGRRRGPRR